MNRNNLALAFLVICPAIIYLLLMFPTPGAMPFGGADSYPYISQLDPQFQANNYCGIAPALATPDGVQWYPQAIGFFSILPTEYAYYLYVEFHLITGAFFFYILCGYVTKKYHLKAIGAFLYGTSFLAINTIQFGNLSFLTAFAYIPIILYFGMRAIKSYWAMDAIIAAIYSAFLFLGGGLLFLFPLLVFLLGKLVEEQLRKPNSKYINFVIVGAGTFAVLTYNKIYFMAHNLFNYIAPRSNWWGSFFYSIRTLTYQTGVTNVFWIFHNVLLLPVYSAAYSGFKSFSKFEKVFFVALLLDILGLLPSFSFAVQHLSFRYSVFLYIFFLLALIKRVSDKNNYKVLLLAMVLFGSTYIDDLRNIRDIQEKPIDLSTGLEINNLTNGGWVVLDNGLFLNPALVFGLQKAGTKLVNPYDSVSYKGSYTCGGYYLSNYPLSSMANLTFVNEPTPRQYFNVSFIKKINNVFLYSIGG